MSAVLFGASPYDSQYSAWAKCTEPTAFAELVDDEADRLFWGNRVQTLILEEYIDQHKPQGGGYAWPQNSICVAKHFPGFATLDALTFSALGQGCCTEIKAMNEYDRPRWKDGPPIEFVIQNLHQQEVTGLHDGLIVVLFGNQIRRLGVYEVPYDEGFCAAIRERCEKFKRYVDERLEPPVDETTMTAEAIRKLHPADNGETVDLPEDSDAWALERLALKDRIKADEKRLTAIDNQITAAIGDATFGVTPGGHCFSWKTQERAEYVAKASTFRVLRPCKAPR